MKRNIIWTENVVIQHYHQPSEIQILKTYILLSHFNEESLRAHAIQEQHRLSTTSRSAGKDRDWPQNGLVKVQMIQEILMPM